MNKKSKIYILFFLILISIYCSFIYKNYKVDKNVDMVDFFLEATMASIILVLFILIQKYKESSKIYNLFNIGFALSFLGHVSDVMDEICEYPKILKNICEDFAKIISFTLLLTGIYLIIKKNELITEKLKQLAHTDSLTGVYNRYEMINRFDLLKKISDRNDTPLSIIYFDIDYFKKINDTYGHLIGDSVLKELAPLISSNLREQDIFGRHGGDEFMIILPETDIKGAVTLAEKLRDKVERFTFEKIPKLTISCGVAQHKRYETIDKTIKRSDDALYISKHKGRNCISSKHDESSFEIPNLV
ncbi:GGDEF domain-containing protein [uncultured Ilyobacter sp.]|uniref:GGDEF domain-containing protein n=1 Tax=uncultured Ilyobacter sp. TaxID=544433 RepID=UPI0029C6B8EF|nr:GGDEF domain-containing protein [uncultured Ilyobacter sp.]